MEASRPGTVTCTERLEVVHMSSVLPAVPLLCGLSDSPTSVITWKISIIRYPAKSARWDGSTNRFSLAYVISLYDNSG